MENQYLIKSSDNSFSIVYERSIIFNKREKKFLKVNDKIDFLWPEDVDKQETYSGKIIKISSKFNVIIFIKTEIFLVNFEFN